ncbi:non-ribosomal peptide synthase (yersiniabactin siderophore biosynthetic protein) [Escherichia coli]|nr:non-ribosomal peptide synthase (yersiniabactin siderophore biosynthetic protein) [Escherichia coli]
MRRTPLYWSRYSIGSRTPARDCTRSRGKYRLFPRSPPTSLMSQRSTRRITGADTCASRCVLSRVFRWRINSAPAFFWRWGPMPQLVACGQREYRDNAYWIASARRNKRRALSSIRPCSSFTLPGVALPWADLLAGDGQRIAAPMLSV